MTNELEATNGLEDAMLREMPKSTTDGKIILPTLQGLAVIFPDEISYVFADEGYASLVLESGEKIFVSRTLREIMDVLPESTFVRPHQSYLVKLDAVRKVHKGDGLVLVLRDKTVIPVSRRNREEVLRALGL